MATTEHNIVSDGLGGGHNGEYYYYCIKCGKKDWIAGYGHLHQLNFYFKPCVPIVKENVMTHETKEYDLIEKLVKEVEFVWYDNSYPEALTVYYTSDQDISLYLNREDFCVTYVNGHYNKSVELEAYEFYYLWGYLITQIKVLIALEEKEELDTFTQNITFLIESKKLNKKLVDNLKELTSDVSE